MLKNCQDRDYAQATEILDQKLGENWEGETFEDIRLNRNLSGFTSRYLFLSANYEEFTSDAEIPILLKLGELDLKKGARVPELVFSCCKWFPKKDAIQSLIQLRDESDTEEKVVKSVIEFQDHEGLNCLIGLFQMASWYRNRTEEYPSGPMLREIDESCLYLIQLSKDFKLDLSKVLNRTAKNGNTLLSEASVFSENVTEYLLAEKDIRVNSIDDTFITPFFRVRFKVDLSK